MADYTVLSLGPVRLVGWEIPESVPLGGVQRVAVNQFMGSNKREVQILGAQPNVIRWSGYFYYESALARARFLDQMRVKGDPIEMTWGEWKYLAVITEFAYRVANIYNIAYDLVLEVIEDRSKPEEAGTGWKGLLDSIIDGINSVLMFINDIAAVIDEINSTIRGYIEKIRRVLKSITGTARRIVNSLTRLGATIIKAPVNVLTGVRQDVSALTDMTDTVIRDLQIPDPGATFTSQIFEAPTNPTVASIPVPATGNDPMVQVVAMNNAAKRLGDLLNRLAQPPFVTTLKTINANVFQIASEYYGDVNVWPQIAEANNLREPLIAGARDLQLPPINGILPRSRKATGTVYETDLYPIPTAETTRANRRLVWHRQGDTR